MREWRLPDGHAHPRLDQRLQHRRGGQSGPHGAAPRRRERTSRGGAGLAGALRFSQDERGSSSRYLSRTHTDS